MAMMVKVFDGTVVEKVNTFLLTSNIQNLFVCFLSVNRESVKELIYQKKNGCHQASKESNIYVTHQNNDQLPGSEHYISHMFDMLVFLMILCASTEKNCLLVCQPDSVPYKNYPGMMKVTCVTCAEKMRINNSRVFS